MDNTNSKPFIVIGDTQRTSFLERTILRREVNDVEQRALFKEIEKLCPEFLVIVGDLVSGGSNHEWNYFFSLVSGLQKIHVPIYPAKGNHDSNIQKHFRYLNKQSWYSKSIGSLGLVWLDTTNHSKIQKSWFERQLTRMDADPKIQNVIVFGHHPPFTNSKVVAPSRYVQKAFVPGFQDGLKTRVFISGHSHSFERFNKGAKTFIVTGGGGGPRHKLNPYPFHYLKITSSAKGLRFDVFGLQKTELQVRHLSTFFLEVKAC